MNKCKKNVVMIRSNPVNPCPRLEKSANALNESGYNVHVLAWDRSENYKPKTDVITMNSGDIPITRIGLKGQFSGGFKKNMRSLIRFLFFIISWLFNNRKKIDIVHAYDFDTGYIACVMCKILKKKLVYDIADYYVDSHSFKQNGWLKKFIIKKENNVINNAEATIICTEKREEQIKGSNPKKLCVIHNSPDSKIYINNEDLSAFKQKMGQNKLNLVYVGIFAKNRFLEEMAETIISRNDIELHIGGYGSNMENYFENMGNTHDNITYYGKLLYQKTLALETSADILCAIYEPSFTNHYFAAPNKFYEALLLGKPLIMVKNTGMSEYVEKYNIGMVIDCSNKNFCDAFNDAIDYLNNNKSDWESMGKRGKALYAEMFSWEIMKERLIKLYDEIKENEE